MREKPSDSVISAWIALMRAQQTTLLKIERAFRDAKLPAHSWYDVLWELERAGSKGLRPYEIERQILIAQSNISRLIDRLEEAGYVERRPCEADGRGQVVVITTTGVAIRKRMWPVYASAINEAVGVKVSEREASALATFLSKLTDRVD